MKSKKYTYDVNKTDWVLFYFVIIKITILLIILKDRPDIDYVNLYLIGIVVNFICTNSRFLVDASYKEYVKKELVDNYYLESKHFYRTILFSSLLVSSFSWLMILSNLWKFVCTCFEEFTEPNKK